MLRFISLLKMQVVIRKEVVMVLRTDDLGLQFLLDVLVGVIEGGLVLPQLTIIIFIVEVFGT